jgi:hypothetical protein
LGAASIHQLGEQRSPVSRIERQRHRFVCLWMLDHDTIGIGAWSKPDRRRRASRDRGGDRVRPEAGHQTTPDGPIQIVIWRHRCPRQHCSDCEANAILSRCSRVQLWQTIRRLRRRLSSSSPRRTRGSRRSFRRRLRLQWLPRHHHRPRLAFVIAALRCLPSSLRLPSSPAFGGGCLARRR